MNNIESIKEDYNIGDPIRIVCSLGIKEGYIVDFREDRIKIRPFEEGRKPISISEENIKDYEEAAPPSGLTNSSSDSFVKPYTENNPQINSDSKIIKDNEKTIPQTDQAPSAGTHPIQEQQESTSSDGGFIKKSNQPSFVLGYVDLKSIDDRGGKRPEVHKYNPWELALQPQPELVCPEYIQRSANSFKKEESNLYLVPATGVITDELRDYGWIWDQNLETKIWFSFDDICDDQLSELDSLVGVHVSYIKINGTKGAKAVGLTLPRPIYELLALADTLQDEKRGDQSSYYVLELILSNYPDNEDAQYLESTLKKSIVKHPKHSVTSKLDLEEIAEFVAAGNEKSISKIVSSKELKEKADKADKEYKIAKALVNEKRHEEALSHYLAAFNLQKSATLVKDISSLYCSLCGKKYIQGHPDRIKQAEKYREEGRKFLANYAYILPKDQSSYNSLESSYYVLHEYDKYIEVVDKIIKIKVPSQRVIFMCKKAVALIALKKKEKAISLLQEILEIDSENINAKSLLEKAKSDQFDDEELAEVSDNPIGEFLQDTLDNYTQFFGVENYIIGDDERLYGDSTYKSIVSQIDKASSDSQKRSLLLLTKIKIDKVRNEGTYDKRDFVHIPEHTRSGFRGCSQQSEGQI